MGKTAKIIVAAAVIAAVCAAAVFLFVRHAARSGHNGAAAAAGTTVFATVPGHAHDHDADAAEPSVSAGITLPTQGGDVTYFSGSYAPDSKAEDTVTGRAVHMRELFGVGYTSARITFSEDGTFTDSLPPTGVRKGLYLVENRALTAAYRPDEVMQIDVTEWSEDGKKPLTFCVTYLTVGDKGYRVFYSQIENKAS